MRQKLRGYVSKSIRRRNYERTEESYGGVMVKSRESVLLGETRPSAGSSLASERTRFPLGKKNATGKYYVEHERIEMIGTGLDGRFVSYIRIFISDSGLFSRFATNFRLNPPTSREIKNNLRSDSSSRSTCSPLECKNADYTKKP